MFGKGGMKLFASCYNRCHRLQSIPSCSTIRMERSAVSVITFDFHRVDEIIDIEINEKRRRDEILRRRVKPRVDDVLPLDPIPPIPLPDLIQDIATQDTQDEQHSTTISLSNTVPKKFCSCQILVQIVSASQIGEKIMYTSVQLWMREILAVSFKVSGYLHEHTRKDECLSTQCSQLQLQRTFLLLSTLICFKCQLRIVANLLCVPLRTS